MSKARRKTRKPTTPEREQSEAVRAIVAKAKNVRPVAFKGTQSKSDKPAPMRSAR